MDFDPWVTGQIGRGSASKKKVARLAGKDPDSRRVHVLIKLHDWSGRAIYLYNLVNEEMRHIPRPSDEVWDQFSTAGVEVPHPGKIQADATEKWVEFGRQEAKRLGLEVGE